MHVCFIRIFRVFIISINIIFMILGITLMSIGIVGKFYPDNAMVSAYESSVKSTMKSVVSGMGEATDELDSWSVTDIFGNVAIAMIAAGATIFIICFIAFVGSAYKIRIYIIIYMVFLFVIVLGQLMGIVIIYSSNAMVIDKLIAQFKTSIDEKYKGAAGTNKETIGWNFIMTKFSCCGTVDYKDFDTATNWQKTLVVNYTTYNLSMPVFCCSTLPTDGNLACATGASGNSATGCFQAVWDVFFGNSTLLTFGFLGSFIIQILIFVFCLLIYLHIRAKNKIDDWDEELTIEPSKETNTREKMVNFNFNIKKIIKKKDKLKQKEAEEKKESRDDDEDE